MAKPLVDDELWAVVEPLLPVPKPRRFRFPGRKPIDHRHALTGIVLVLKTGIGWEDLPQEMDCGSGMILRQAQDRLCWRRLSDRWIGTALFGFSLGIGVWLLTLPVGITYDDGYYYLVIARNLAQGHGSTFDGIHATNGYHPLWLLCLAVIFAFTPSAQNAITLSNILQSFLFALGAAVLYGCARRSLGRIAASLVVWLWILQSNRNAMAGLEFSLHALLMFTLAYVYLRWFTGDRLPPLRHYAALGVLAGLMILARLETAVLAVVMGVFLLTQLSRSRATMQEVRRVLAYALPVGVLGVSYALVNQVVFGHVLTVSAYAKHLWSDYQLASDPIFRAHGWLVAKLALLLLPLSALRPWALQPGWWRELLLATGAYGFAILWLLLAIAVGRRPSLREPLDCLRPWRPFIVFSLLNVLGFVVLYHAGLAWTSWYYVAQPWLGALLVGMLAQRLLDSGLRSTTPNGLWRRSRRLIPLMVVGLWLLVPVYTAREVLSDGIRERLNPEREPFLDAAMWIRSNMPGDAIVGAWNAGIVGYYSERAVVNLDGLVNTWEFLDSQQYDLCAYWRETGITYLSDQFVGLEPTTPLPGLQDFSRCAGQMELLWSSDVEGRRYQMKIFQIR